MARFLDWNEVIQLPPEQEKWVQYGNKELIHDTLRYNPEADDMYLDWDMSVYTKASLTYRKSWVVWDSIPTEEQFLNNEWRLH